MLLQLEGGQGSKCVGVFGGAHDDGIDVICGVVYPAKILITTRSRIFQRGGVQGHLVHVAESHNIFGARRI